MSEHENCHVEPLRKPLDRRALATSEVAFLIVAGMDCPNCAARVRNALLALENVLHVDVTLTRGIAAVAFRSEELIPADLIMAVSGAGDEAGYHYSAKLLQTMSAREAFTFAS